MTATAAAEILSGLSTQSAAEYRALVTGLAKGAQPEPSEIRAILADANRSREQLADDVSLASRRFEAVRRLGEAESLEGEIPGLKADASAKLSKFVAEEQKLAELRETKLRPAKKAADASAAALRQAEAKLAAARREGLGALWPTAAPELRERFKALSDAATRSRARVQQAERSDLGARAARLPEAEAEESHLRDELEQLQERGVSPTADIALGLRRKLAVAEERLERARRAAEQLDELRQAAEDAEREFDEFERGEYRDADRFAID